MNAINRYDIKDCLSLFFVVDESDSSVWIIWFIHVDRRQDGLFDSRSFLRTESEIFYISRASSSAPLCSGWFTWCLLVHL